MGAGPGLRCRSGGPRGWRPVAAVPRAGESLASWGQAEGTGRRGRGGVLRPVVSTTPRGEVACVLWDGVLGVAGTDGFFESKRSRTQDPDFTW